MANIEADRWAVALGRIEEIERKSSLLSKRLLRRKFAYARRSAWATPGGREVLPRDQQPDIAGLGRIRHRISAESVLIGKFDVDKEVRLRAFYPNHGLSIRYQTGGQRNGITQTVNAHKRIHPHVEGLMPAIHEHGTILDGQGAYLIENTVRGEPITRSQLQDFIVPITSRLHAAQQGVGIAPKNLSRIVGGMYRTRWNSFVESTSADPRLDAAVQKLMDRNELLDVSITHGDLVNSNILATEDDFVLVDWEFSAMKPVAFDMAKIIINVDNIEKTLHQMHTGLGGTIGGSSGHYSFREQVALALVQTLSWYPNHLTKATAAGRTAALKRQTTKRLAAMTELLEID